VRINRLMNILDDWSRWMKVDKHGLGYPSSTSYFFTGGESTSEVFEDMVSKTDMNNIKIVDAVIDGLDKNQKSAIYYRFLGGKKPMFYEKNLDLAFDNLLTVTSKRIYA
jgi:hypothetical protein